MNQEPTYRDLVYAEQSGLAEMVTDISIRLAFSRFDPMASLALCRASEIDMPRQTLKERGLNCVRLFAYWSSDESLEREEFLLLSNKQVMGLNVQYHGPFDSPNVGAVVAAITSSAPLAMTLRCVRYPIQGYVEALVAQCLR